MRWFLVTAMLGFAAAVPCAAQAQDAPDAAPERGFFDVDETSWVLRTEYNGPRDDFGRDFRKIGLTTVEVQRAWTFHGPFELRAGGGVTYAKGTTSEPFATTPPSDVDVLGFNGGVEARVDVVRTKGFRLFVDGSVNMLWTHGTQFPPGGSGVNGYLRTGPGAMVRLNDRLALETGYHWSHVSNGAGEVTHNPAFNGHGGYLSIRWTPGK